MQSNLSLAVEFKGSVAINGVPAVMEGSQRMLQTKGGIISGSGNTDGSAFFGIVMSVLASGTGYDESALFIGYPSGSSYAIVGVLLNEQGIRENDPAKPNWISNEQPATVVNRGRLLFASWGKTATGAVDPYPGCRVIFKNTTGKIEFIPQGYTVPSGWTQLQAAVISNNPFTGFVDLDIFIPQAN